MSKPAITMSDLGLTPGEQQLFAQGARHLYGDEPTTTPDEPAVTPAKPKAPKPPKAAPAPKPKAQGALSGFTVKGSPGARKNKLPGQAKGGA